MEDINLTRRQALGLFGAGLALTAVPLFGCTGSAGHQRYYQYYAIGRW